MFTTLHDLKIKAENFMFNTRLPKSFLGLLVSSLEEDGVRVFNIYDDEHNTNVVTSYGTLTMRDCVSVNDFKAKLRDEVFRKLNERFDDRVELLKSKGYSYYKKYVCFAKSEKAAQNGDCIPNAAVMHMDEFIFKLRLDL